MADGKQPAPLGAGYETTITRTFKAPPELLFDCFIDPEHLAKWWGPLGCVASEVSADATPGGLLSLRMAGPGYDHVMGGEYVEVERPNKIVLLTKAFKQPDGNWGIINRNTITLERLNDSFTRLHLHVRVDRAEGELVLGALGGMRAGWGQQLERLGDLTGGGGKMDFDVGDQQVVVSRAFDAPRELVWKALTDPAAFGQWWISGAGKVEEMDVRPGGKWSFRADAGGRFWGEYTEVDPPSRLALTQGFDDHAAVPVVYELKAEWGRTTLTRTMTFPDNAYRDGMLSSGFEPAAAAGFDALAQMLKTL